MEGKPLKNLTAGLNEKYNIDQFRRRKKMRKLLKTALLVFLCLLLAVGVYFLVDTFRQRAVSSQTAAVDSFPINLKGEEPGGLLAVNNNLVVLGNNKILYYTPSATKQTDIVHGMATPVQTEKDGRVLTYDQNGTAWRLDHDGKLVKEAKTDNGILFGRLGNGGMIALATFADRFNTSLTVYDKEFNQKYKYNESQNYIVGFEFLSNSKGLLLEQRVEGTAIDSIVLGLDFTVSEGTEFFKAELQDTIVYTMSVQSNGTILLVTDRGVILLDQEGKQTEATPYEEKIRAVENRGSSTVIALENQQDTNKTDLLVINSDGTTKTRTTVEGIVRDLYCDRDRILLLNKEKVLVFDYSFELISSYDNAKNYSRVIRLNQDIYGMNSEYLYVVE